MASVGKTYFSKNFGQTFEVSDGTMYVDEEKPPAPTSISFEDISGFVQATIVFNRTIDKLTRSNGTQSGVIHYLNGGGSINGVHGPDSHPAIADPYSMQINMLLTASGHIGGDTFTYAPSVTSISGSNGVDVEAFIIRETNNFPNAQTAVVNVNGPDIEIIITFDKDLVDNTTSIANQTMTYKNILHVLVDQNYPQSNQWRTTWTQEQAGSGNVFNYAPTLSLKLTGVNGVLVRTLEVNLDGTAAGVTINE